MCHVRSLKTSLFFILLVVVFLCSSCASVDSKEGPKKAPSKGRFGGYHPHTHAPGRH